jgi:signal transduction histidine kinase
VIENAIAHSDADDAAVRVVVEADSDAGEVTIEVSDDGPGIPRRELAVLEDGTESALEHGSGIGLWIVEWSLQRLGGDVRYETSSAGTTVNLALPWASTAERVPLERAETNGHK